MQEGSNFFMSSPTSLNIFLKTVFFGAVKQNLWKFKFTEHFGTLLGELFIGSSLNADTRLLGAIVFDSSASFKAPSPAPSILMGHFLIGLYFPIFSLQHTKPSSPNPLSISSPKLQSQSFNRKTAPPSTALVQLDTL